MIIRNSFTVIVKYIQSPKLLFEVFYSNERQMELSKQGKNILLEGDYVT